MFLSGSGLLPLSSLLVIPVVGSLPPPAGVSPPNPALLENNSEQTTTQNKNNIASLAGWHWLLEIPPGGQTALPNPTSHNARGVENRFCPSSYVGAPFGRFVTLCNSAFTVVAGTSTATKGRVHILRKSVNLFIFCVNSADLPHVSRVLAKKRVFCKSCAHIHSSRCRAYPRPHPFPRPIVLATCPPLWQRQVLRGPDPPPANTRRR